MGEEMSFSEISKSKNKQTLKINIEERDFTLDLELNPREYFYPYLLVGPDYVHDYSYWEEYGMSKEDYKKHKKINKMLQDKKYSDLFEKKLAENLKHFLRTLEYEVRIQYEDGESLEQKISKKEDTIFELIEKRGENAFTHAAVLEKIREWCNAKDSSKIENLSKALWEYGKISRSYLSFYDFEERVGIIFKYPFLRKRISELKKDIRLKEKMYRRHKRLEEAIIAEWREKSQDEVIIRIPWFEILIKLAAEEESDFISFIKQYPPRELCIRIYADHIYKSPFTVDQILRKKAKILKTWVKFGSEM
jgi:hypothetical protein